MPKKKEYNNESLKSLKGPDRVRKKPAVIFGSDDIEGAQQAVFEIISNSVDEAREGYGNKIIVTKYDDGSISIEDFGRGIPIEWNKAENQYNHFLAFEDLFAGGKYAQDDGENYSAALGTNGLGLCSTQYSSEWMDVRVRRDGYEYTLHYEKGFNKMPEPGFKKKKSKEHTGSFIRFKLDSEVFTDTDVSAEYLISCMKRQAIVNKGVELIFVQGERTESFLYEEGLTEYVKELSKSPISLIQNFSSKGKGRDAENRPEYNLNANFAFVFVKEGGVQEFYHNSSWLEYGGSPMKAMQKAFTASLDRYIKNHGKYLKSESKISISDIEDSLIFVSSGFSNFASYENQTKKSIKNAFIEKEEQRVLEEYLDKYLAENATEADAITAQVLINKRAREQAENQKVSIKKKLTGKMDAFTRPDNFVDCRSKKAEERELFLCLKGDTKVKLLNGTSPTIESLVGQEGLWAYSTDNIGRMIPAQIKKVFKTRDVTETVVITLSDGSAVECTPEHLFLHRDTLQWVEAKDLKPGDSLSSMKFKYDIKNKEGYEGVWVPEQYTKYNSKTKKKQGHWELTHRRIADILGLSQPYDGVQKLNVHHKDNNKLNNDPSNLEVLTPSEHRTAHNREWHDSGKWAEQFYNMSDESRERMNTGYRNWSDEGAERIRQGTIKSWKDNPHNPKRTWTRYNNSPKFWDDVEKNRVVHSENMKRRWANMTEEEYQEAVEGNRQKSKMRLYVQAIKIAQGILFAGCEINEANWSGYRDKGEIKYANAIKRFGSVEQLKEEAKNYNLKVKSVEQRTYTSPIPVYCLNIDSEFHSFVLDNGLITHNCEGLSAFGSLKQARNSEFQAIQALRGKVLNCAKVDISKIFKSEIITDIIKVLGCGVEVKTNAKGIPEFDIDKLRFNKVIIITDADVDGAHITCLLLTMFYRLMPTLIKEGKIYICETPLYEITYKDKTFFAHNDKEKDKIVRGIKGAGVKIQRSKGLGENDAEMMALTGMNPGTRRLIRITESKAKDLYDILMGDNLSARKEYISLHGGEYTDLDI